MLEVQKSPNKIRFRVSGDLVKKLHDWEYSIDEMVFKEQLVTGSFKGRLLVPEYILEIMQHAEKQGIILPYYGFISSRGCVYKFRLKGSKCNLISENFLTGDVLDLEVDIKQENKFFGIIRELAIQFSFLSHVIAEKLGHPWAGKRNSTLVCQIAEQEYQTLKKWKTWMNDQALTPRYIYKFTPVSLGVPGGFAAKVEDTETGEIIDPNDYKNW